MHTAARLGLFAAGAAAVFTAAFVAAPLVIPADASAAWTSNEDDHMTTAEPGHGDEHTGAAASADDVRGLAVSHAGYTLTGLRAPASPGEQGELAFGITDAAGAPLTDYETSHERDLHLIVVRTDGAHFRHVHPVIDDRGEWSLPFAFDAAGTYRVFADFVPAGHGETVTLTTTVDVAGGFAPEPRTSDATAATVDGITVEVEGELVAGAERELVFTVTRDGEPVTTLEPYLGAYGHLVALRQGDLAYLHVHPMGEPGDGVAEAGPEISFMATAPTAGRYLLYLDVQLDGVVHSIPLVLTAGAGSTDAAGGAAHDGTHDDDHDDGHDDDHGEAGR
ncbi:heavy-metal-associated domain-containing protein [Agromyces indicus]|uniref:Heavy-metal-associated domain-containing protein n=1 Tax=Agromyces indicus TaxID=758919 RepID=A0ABU1FNB9_9MICO|nr:heavy-metal-associated domain-containing protein [Agromyces indicus]MDR5692961.1 heavy-metal-associated domain-containing protein [Agromyces indicus]